MRLIHRRAMTVLVAVVLVASFAIAPSVSGAAAKKKGNPITKLSKRVTALRRTVNTLATNLKNVTNTVNQGIPIITQLVTGLQQASAGLTALKTALTTVGNGLTTLSTAVQDPTTGLPGLNGARSQFGAFTTTGTFISGTGAHPPAKGPSGDATEGGAPVANAYVVDFGNDVSARFLSVTQFPTGGASTNRVGMAVDCAASAAASTLCGTVAGGAPDSNPNHVVVQFGSVTSGAADGSWEIAAISG